MNEVESPIDFHAAKDPEQGWGLAGTLLIAAPTLRDPNFSRQVILMVQHNDQGAFGIVLGHPTQRPLTLRELAKEQGVTWHRYDNPRVRFGGPCEPQRIFLLYLLKEQGESGAPLVDSQAVLPGLPIYLGSSADLIRDLDRHPDSHVLAYSGYAGWGPGQLEKEMQEKSWLPGDVSEDLLFETDPDDIWEEALRPLGASTAFIGHGRGASA